MSTTTRLSTRRKSVTAKREALRYGEEKEQIRQKAEAQERAGKEADEASEKAVPHHHRWAQAVVAVQVSIFNCTGGNYAAHTAPMAAGGFVWGWRDWWHAGRAFNAPHLGKGGQQW